MIHPDLISRIALHQPRLAVRDLWLLIARAQLCESLPWLGRYLWDHRVASFLSSDAALEHCMTCGARLSGGRSDKSCCSQACRSKRSRFRKLGKLTPMAQAIVDARACLSEMENEISDWRKWYRRKQATIILPPNLLRVQHLPKLPGRCGQGCDRGVGCSHTDGSACFFAGTMGGSEDG